jgi:hypothetical protein
LNVNTNEFDVTEEQPRPNRSKFNFGANNEPSDSWAFDAQQGWGSGPIYADTWNNVNEADQHVTADRFSKKEVATFRLNTEISEVPVFTKVTDYTEFREKTILPNYEDLMLDPVPPPDDYDLNIPSYRLPLPNIPVNKTKNAYDSVDQYLYTHFELMRNDCLIPLQKAVRSYRETHETLKDTADYGETMEANSAPKPFRLYEHVCIMMIMIMINRTGWPRFSK